MDLFIRPSDVAVIYIIIMSMMVFDMCAALSSYCPVTKSKYDASSSGSSRCHCTILSEIHCTGGLNEVPDFTDADEDTMFIGLYMVRQNIHNVHSSAFAGIKLRKIVLNLNHLDDRLHEDAFRGVDWMLHELHLSACRLRSVAAGLLRSMTQLKYLHLWGNRIETIPSGLFRDTVNLVELLLWGNDIDELDESTFYGLRQLKRLDLDQNKISNLPRAAFQHLVSLETLHLRYNKIHALESETFVGMPSLRVLNLDSNGLGYIYPSAFDGLFNLSSLSLANNRINLLLDEVFSGLHRLKSLWLHNNFLEHVYSRTFYGLRSLNILCLSRNHLSVLRESVFGQSSRLRHLYLENNNLTTLKRCSLSEKTRLKTLSLLGNPIHCDCELIWVYNQVYHPQGHLMNVYGTCSDPDIGLTSILLALSPNKVGVSVASRCVSPVKVSSC